MQHDCRLLDKEANLTQACRIVEEWKGRVHLLCFTELFTTGYHLASIGPRLAELAEPIDGPTMARLGEAARRCGVAVCGTIVEREERGGAARFFNTAVLIDRLGRLRGTHRKAHLYPSERAYFAQGDAVTVVDAQITPAGPPVRVGLAVCFEHAFPEVFRLHALAGAWLVLIPSVVPVGYEHLLDLRTRARAQDNQYFVVAANRVGTERGVSYCGHSQIAGPDGRVVASAGREEQVVVAEIDLGEVHREREREPALRCLRPELYREVRYGRGGLHPNP